MINSSKLNEHSLKLVLILQSIWKGVLMYAPVEVKLDFKAHEIHRIDTLNILAYTFLLISTVITIWAFKIRRFRFIHETGLAIIYGLIVGSIIKYVGDANTEYTYLKVLPVTVIQKIDQQYHNMSKEINYTLQSSSISNVNLSNLIRDSTLNKSSSLNLNQSSLHKFDLNLNINKDVVLNETLKEKNNSTLLSSFEKNNLNNTSISTTNLNQTNIQKTKSNSIKESSIRPINTISKTSLIRSNKKLTNIFNDDFKNLNQTNDLLEKMPTKIKPLTSTVKSFLLNKTNDKDELLNLDKSIDAGRLGKIIVENSTDKPRPDHGMTLRLQAPPDSLWVPLEIDDKTQNLTSSKNYVYTFKGELVNHAQSAGDLYISQKATFDPEIFFNIIIPLIVLNAGYSLKRRFFFRNLGAIMSYAFLGTTISCFTIACVLYMLIQLLPRFGFNFTDCLYFGALISATDTITILAVFNDLNLDVNLYALVFGESILNDAVAIVLVRSIDLFERELSLNLNENRGLLYSAFNGCIEFWRVFLFSVLIGIFVGILNALLTKFTKLREFHLLESSLFVLMSYSAFLISELLELSGIVTILFCGICQAHYTYNNLSLESRHTTKKFTELLSFLAENFIFTYLGVSMFTYPAHKWAISIIIFSFIAMIIGRMLNIYPISFLLNVNRSKKIPLKHQHILFFSGLRGAMAYALASRNAISDARQIILTTTSIIAIITVIVGGGMTNYILELFEIDTGVQENDQEMLPFSKTNSSNHPEQNLQNYGNANDKTPDQKNFDNINSALKQNCGQKVVEEKIWFVKKWYLFDVKFMKPLLTNSTPTLIDTLPNLFLPISRLLTTTEQLNIALNSNYNETGITNGFNNINFTGVISEGDLDGNVLERASNYQRYSFENSIFDGNYLSLNLDQTASNPNSLNDPFEKNSSQIDQQSNLEKMSAIQSNVKINSQIKQNFHFRK